MTLIDWGMVTIIAISTIFSLWRGAVKEIISLTTWVLAGYLAYRFHDLFGAVLSPYIKSPLVGSVISALLIIVVVVIIGSLISALVSRGISKIGLGPLDKLFGMIFGALRGALIIMVVVMMMEVTEVPSESWWKSSKLLPLFEDAATQTINWFSANGWPDIKVKLKDYMSTLSSEVGTSSKPSDTTDTGETPQTVMPGSSDDQPPPSTLGTPQTVMPDETPPPDNPNPMGPNNNGGIGGISPNVLKQLQP